MDIEQLEALALGDDRAAALAGLVAGTEEHDTWRAIHLQHAGALDEVDAILAQWGSRHGDTPARRRIARRQLLLRAGQDLERVRDRLRDETHAQLQHEPEIEATAARHPTRFEDGALAEDKLLGLALTRGRGLDEITPAGLPGLLRRPLHAHHARQLLERIDRAGLPGLIALIAAELADKSSRGFGSLAVHQHLTRAELDELARAHPALRQHQAWVEAVVTRMRPPSHVDWELDVAARIAYLDELWAEVAPLPPTFNSLKVHVLYHRLACDLRTGVFDRDRLLAYLALPRRGGYVRAAWLKDREPATVAALDQHYGRFTGLPAVGGDEPLVRTYLGRFLRSEDETAFSEYLEAQWLRELLAEVRLLAGDPDVDRWTRVLGPTTATSLRDRVELELAPTNPRRFARDAAVALEVDVKHAGTLRLRVFRVNVPAYFHAHGADVDTTLDLDGLAAGWEELRPWTAPPLHRVRTRFELAACDRPGTYIVELIAGGKASRALVRKGDLRYTARPSAAGLALAILDEAGRRCPGARVWMGGREYRPREDGEIMLPFSTAGGSVPLLLVDGELAVVSSVVLPAERYELEAAVLLDRQALVPGREATALVRASLTLGGVPAPLALLEEPYAEIVATDRAGVTARRRMPLVLADDAEVALPIAVPPDLAALAIGVGGRVRMVSEQRTIDLRRDLAVEVGTMHGALATEALHLARDEGGFRLLLLGKTGEPRAGRAVTLEMSLRAVTFRWQATLTTDERGAIELGPLPGVLELRATTTTGLDQRFPLAGPPPAFAPRLTAAAGDDVVIPIADDERADLAVIELRGGLPAHDHTAGARREPGALRLVGLPAGEFRIRVRGQAGVELTVVPAAAPRAAGWATLARALVELRPPLPVLGAITAGPASLEIEVAGASPHTRVHVIASPLWPAPAWSADLAAALYPAARLHQSPAESQYVSGRDIGDEYRYVLDRQQAPRRAGLLLDKPSVLLNPWALRATSTATQTARAQAAWADSAQRSALIGAGAPSGHRDRLRGPGGGDGAFAAHDFLAAPPIVRANLRPDAAGRCRVERAALGDATLVRVVLVDPAGTAVRTVALPPRPLAVTDLRLAAALPADRHLREDRSLQPLAAGVALAIADRATTRVELVDTVDKLYRTLCALSQHGELVAWDFLPRWGALGRAEKLALYSRHACHELALFIHAKDRPLFDEALRPYLASKLHKTFIDHWLLDADLTPYLASWRFARLNAVERALLAQRLPDHRAAIARSLADAVDLVPPDPESDDRVVDAFLAGGKLAGGDGETGAAAALAPAEEIAAELDAAPPLPKAKKRERMARSMGPPATPMPAPAPMQAASFGPPGAPPALLDAERTRADLAQRETAAPLYRGADRTQEWAEHDWWHTKVADAGPAHVPVARLWRDLAAHPGGPFLSPHLADLGAGFAANVCALAFLDLPFTAAAHTITARGTGVDLRAGSPALAAIAALADVAGPPSEQVLVGQSYFRADDRWEWDGAEQREKYVTGELLAGVVYQCQVVVTNPTSRLQRLAVLLQIPAGAIAVGGNVATRTHRLELSPYATSSLEVAFYFPSPGRFEHYGARVTSPQRANASGVNAVGREASDALVAAAAGRTLTVVREPTAVDTASWSHVSQRGSLDEVVAFLTTHNLGRIDLTRVAWRMRDRVAFERILAALAARHVHEPALWAYALVHGDRARAAEWLAHQDGFLAAAGPDLDDGLVPLEPVARGLYQHLEYAPLVNARAHRLGDRRTVLNDGLAAQWRRFLERVASRRAPAAADWLAAAHYLFTMDRPDDAARALARAAADGATTAALPHAYLAAYDAAARGDLPAARAHAAPHAGHPVDRWRHRFAALVAMLDEVAGTPAPADVGAADHRERTLDALAARQPALAIEVSGGDVVLTHHHLERAELRFYRMDVELLFSRQPFLGAAGDRFSFIAPGHAADVTLAAGGRTTVRIPDAMAHANLVIEAVAGPLRASVTHFANDLAVAVLAPYGQLQVRRAAGAAALPATYVKTYARLRGGAVQFYKDGYTDLRGRFDYATLSTSELEQVERFALLVLHDAAGAVVLEAEPPTR